MTSVLVDGIGELVTNSPAVGHGLGVLTNASAAATPPGPGVHVMCGADAAQQALRYLRRQGAA